MGFLAQALQNTPIHDGPDVFHREEKTPVHKVVLQSHASDVEVAQIKALALALEGLSARLVVAGVLAPDDVRIELAQLRDAMKRGAASK